MILIVLILSGCTITKEGRNVRDDLKFDIPATWTSGSLPSDEKLNLGWLKKMQDPVLEGLVLEALANNQDLAAAAARMQAVWSQSRISIAELYPRLRGEIGGSKNQRTSSSGFQLTNPRTTNYSANLFTNWELDLWGRLRNRKNAALSDFEASEANYRAAQLSVSVQVAKAWYNAIESNLQLNLARKTVANFQHTLDVTEKGYLNGINSALDVRLAKVNVSTAESNYAGQAIRLDETLRTLEILLGRYPSAQVNTAQDLPSFKQTIPPGLPSELLKRRPDLVAAEAELIAADRRFKDEEKNFLPNISLTGSGGTTGEKLKNLLNFNFLVWSIAADLVQPIFEGGRLKAQRKMAEANVNEAIAEYAQSVLTAFQEVELALSAEENLARQEDALAQSQNDSIQAERLARERYQKGLEDIITLLDTQQRTVTIQRSYLEINNQRIQNRLNLILALGGDFLDDKVLQQPVDARIE